MVSRINGHPNGIVDADFCIQLEERWVVVLRPDVQRKHGQLIRLSAAHGIQADGLPSRILALA